METHFLTQDQAILWKRENETLRVEPWGPDAVRVRAAQHPDFANIPNALLDAPAGAQPEIRLDAEQAVLENGRIRVEINQAGRIRFLNSASGDVLLEEPVRMFYHPAPRSFKAKSSDLFELEATFESQPGERFYGLGQHQHGRLNQKGCVIPLEQRNTEVCIPFLLSNRGYGFLWNNPSVGRVELAENSTRWVAMATRQLDYVVFAGDNPAQLVSRYVHTTGEPPLLPEWALGFWQCKLRYRTQEELLEVAREYKRRGLPLAVIVVDYFHWTMMGDWQFDPDFWPNPAAMVRELKEMGVELMVSVWATINPISKNYAIMKEKGLLVRSERGNPAPMEIWDRYPENGPVYINYYDPTNPEARKFVWEQIRKNYYDLGIRVLWLDACEPEIYPMHHDNLRYAAGNGMEVSSIYPLLHQQAFYEGMQSVGEKEAVFLSRSAWAGSQRYGTAVWSGDIPSTFETLRKQVPAGLNIAMSGIPWWTTDIGGFLDGDIRDPEFQELIVRWFQYGVFCPIFRLHGARLPFNGEAGAFASGAPNEVWSFGNRDYAIIKDLLFLREKLKPYLMHLNQQAHETGQPPMRPLFFDFPEDPAAWQVEDAFLLGPDLLVAPVMNKGQQQREVYLPAGADWICAWDGSEAPGGTTQVVNTPLESIPVYWRKGSSWQFAFKS